MPDAVKPLFVAEVQHKPSRFAWGKGCLLVVTPGAVVVLDAQVGKLGGLPLGGPLRPGFADRGHVLAEGERGRRAGRPRGPPSHIRTHRVANHEPDLPLAGLCAERESTPQPVNPPAPHRRGLAPPPQSQDQAESRDGVIRTQLAVRPAEVRKRGSGGD